MNKKFSFFTFATGKKYLSLSFALARSFKFHNSASISFWIFSDAEFNLPWDLNWVQKKIYQKGEVGHGLEFKLHLLDIAPTPYAIFIDADSLIYGDLSNLFATFGTDTPNVIGMKVDNGTWVDENVSSTCEEFEISYMIRYCGALYYLVKNDRGREIFEYAKNLYNSGRAFQRNEKTMYDEPILSIAFSKFNIDPLPDDGNIWGDLVQFNYHSRLNVFKGPAEFNNYPNDRRYKFWLPDGVYHPQILHVGSGNFYKNPWTFDSLRLKLHYKFFLPVFLANGIVNFIIIPVYFLARRIFR